MFAAIKLFNRLPKIIQSLKEDRMSFRNKLSSYLMSNSFYTVSEYLECNLNNYFILFCCICFFIVFNDDVHLHLFGPVK
jgi:hypothetical protein